MRIAPTFCFILILGVATPAARAAAEDFTDTFDLSGCTFSDVGENRYFSLDPGHRIVLEEEDDGAWRAGVDGAQPGIIMPGTFLLGSRYAQELAPDVALNRAEHVAIGLTVEVPAGTFEDCVEVHESIPLEPGASSVKIYCPEVGFVDDSGAVLIETDGEVSHGQPARAPGGLR